jgi:hypothetical protein
MPESETAITVIDNNSGHSRDTRNWVLGRLLRDFNDRIDEEMKYEQPHISSDQKRASTADGSGNGNGKQKPFEGLRVTVFEVKDEASLEHGVPTRDWVWYSGFAVIVIQLGIAIIPWGVNGQWNIFLVTAAGNLFALIGGSLPQWRREKWACPKRGGDTTTITEGNGSRSAIVILGKKGVGLKFEVLARSTRMAPATLLTRVATPVLAVLWILLLITVAGIKQDTYCKIPRSLIYFGTFPSPFQYGLLPLTPDIKICSALASLAASRTSSPLESTDRNPPLASTSKRSRRLGLDMCPKR